MPTYTYKPGLGSAASYQVSGKPFVSGGVDINAGGGLKTITFPSVARWVVVTNNTPGICKVGFSANGVANNNYLSVPSGTMSPRLEIKATEVYLGGTSTDVDIMAGLTYIGTGDINNVSNSPSGSNWSGSLGAEVG